MIEIGKAGLYFHIPFCRSKCPYCDFYSVKYEKQACRDYVDLVLDEIKKYKGSFDTIYFGGGTPSIIPPELIGEIIHASREQFDIAYDCEITVECNPSKDLREDFKLYKSYGVNRISLGMQSAVDEERFALGRIAGQREVERAVFDAKNTGIDNISLDLMLATPKQTLASLEKTFDFIDKMDVKHISAYLLKIEKGTRFYDISDRLALPDEDTACDMYLKTVHILSSLGFKQYEISNFAKNGFKSRHNIKYWKLDEYLGIGKSAHSFWNGKRFYYDNHFNKTDDGVGGDLKERIMLGLRLNEGIDKSLVKKEYSQFIKMGLMRENETNIFLTPEGMLVSNLIINEIT